MVTKTKKQAFLTAYLFNTFLQWLYWIQAWSQRHAKELE